MKVATLLVGSFLLALLFAPAPVQAQWCQDINGPYWCGDPDACQGVCSDPNSDCTTPCKQFNTWKTCGGTATDSDNDGVSNSTDNCVCTSNSNQADCDSDGTGTACDSLNANYVLYSEQLCMVDRDTHVGYFELERHIDQRYVDTSSCGAPDTYDTYEDGNSAWCSNISTYDCCINVLQESSWWCNRVDQDFCLGN